MKAGIETERLPASGSGELIPAAYCQKHLLLSQGPHLQSKNTAYRTYCLGLDPLLSQLSVRHQGDYSARVYTEGVSRSVL